MIETSQSDDMGKERLKTENDRTLKGAPAHNLQNREKNII